MKLCEAESVFFGKTFLPPKLGKWGKNGPKIGVFKFIEKFGYFSLNLSCNENLYYIMFTDKSHILEKILFLRYRPKCCQPIRLFYILQLYLQNKIDEIARVFTCWYKFTKFKSWSIFFYFVKNACGQLGTNSGKLKVASVSFGWTCKTGEIWRTLVSCAYYIFVSISSL